jgi:hypothetical protein
MSINRNDIQKFGTYYKLRHIPSGLFYVPSSFRTMTNLCKFGKLYNAIPQDLREGKYSYFYDENNVKRLIFLEDWEIVEVEFKEINTLNYKNEISRKPSNKFSE